MGKEHRSNVILSFLAVVSLSAFPVFFLYFHNVDQIQFRKVLFPLAILVLFSIFLALLLSVIMKSISKGFLSACLVMLILENFALLKNGLQYLIPNLQYWHSLEIFIWIIGHIIYLIATKAKIEFTKNINKIIAVVFLVLILFNGILAFPHILTSFEINHQKEIEVKEPDSSRIMPNIYYLLFDEYSSFDVIEKYYAYDNSDFGKNLTKLGFNVSYTSHNNAYDTNTITANYFNLEYVAKSDMLEPVKRQIRTNNKLFPMMIENGYDIIGIGASNILFEDNPLIHYETETDLESATTKDGESFDQVVFKNTVVYPFIKQNMNEYTQPIISSRNYLLSAHENRSNNTFTISYIMFPHVPFVYDKYGNDVSPENYYNWQDKQYYLGAYIYCTRLIKDEVTQLVKDDPDCIVIIQSDHSARALSDLELTFRIEDVDKKSIVNAVYFQGKVLDIDGLSGLNTLRKTLGQILDEELPLVSD